MNKFKYWLAVMLIIVSAVPVVFFHAEAETNVIRVSTTTELQNAMKNASPGDEIVIAPGEYTGKLGANYSGYGSAYFNSDKSGTAANPIILRSEDPQNRAILKGERTTSCYALRINGDYWLIRDIDVTLAQKGIMLDSANHCVLENCYVYNVGMEGIHFRDGSCYNTAKNCTVKDTGVSSAGMGEGFYVGSANGSWNEYAKECNYNTITHCTIGPNCSAEAVDIKEGTTGTVVEYCTIYGEGISGQNYADSFIDIKGDNASILYNTCYAGGSTIIVDAFQLHNQIDTWGQNANISYNTVYFNAGDTSSNVINATHDTSAYTYGNTRSPSGNMYTGDVSELEPPQELPLSIDSIDENNGRFTVNVSGGKGSYLYSAYLLSSGNVYYSSLWSTSNVITPDMSSDADEYILRVYVRDSSGEKLAENVVISF